MALNGLVKGKEGEREIARDLNAVLDDALRELGLPPQDPEHPRVQRNQNQSAVGGCDLIGTFDIAIEVKRQEQLAINTWWAQCVASAKKLQHHPVLVFRQNTPGGGRKLWRVLTLVDIPVPGCEPVRARAELNYDDFKCWFKAWAIEQLKSEHRIGAVQRTPIIPEQAESLTEEEVESVATRQRFPDLFADQ